MYKRQEEQRVNREIATLGVLLRRVGVHHPIGVATVGIADIGTKRGDLNLRDLSLNRLARFGIFGDNDDSELRADREAAREKLLDTIRRGVGGDIVVGGFAFEQNIAHAAADEVGLMARRAQGAADAFRKCASVHGHNYD